jgi:hypothetical protein
LEENQRERRLIDFRSFPSFQQTIFDSIDDLFLSVCIRAETIAAAKSVNLRDKRGSLRLLLLVLLVDTSTIMKLTVSCVVRTVNL